MAPGADAPGPERKSPGRKAEVPPQFDLNSLSGTYDVSASFKPKERRREVLSRLKIAERREEGRLLHETIILIAVVAIVSLTSLHCMWITARPGYSPETVKWATSVLTAIISGGLGVLVGEKVAKSP